MANVLKTLGKPNSKKFKNQSRWSFQATEIYQKLRTFPDFSIKPVFQKNITG